MPRRAAAAAQAPRPPGRGVRPHLVGRAQQRAQVGAARPPPLPRPGLDQRVAERRGLHRPRHHRQTAGVRGQLRRAGCCALPRRPGGRRRCPAARQLGGRGARSGGRPARGCRGCSARSRPRSAAGLPGLGCTSGRSGSACHRAGGTRGSSASTTAVKGGHLLRGRQELGAGPLSCPLRPTCAATPAAATAP